jgi:hypothetical protein
MSYNHNTEYVTPDTSPRKLKIIVDARDYQVWNNETRRFGMYRTEYLHDGSFYTKKKK